jgi:murein L,D-transpeptidase YafK
MKISQLALCTLFLAPIQSWSQEMFPENLLQISATEAFSKYVFVVDKSLRKLMVFERNGETIRKVEDLSADIGKNVGKKEKQDDHRTPEGIYFFQEKKTPPSIPFSLYGKMAFTMDYPNLFDRQDGKTGYGIWLHSVPDNVPLTRGSRGCVVVRNEDIIRLEKYISFKQTPILIFDKIKYVDLSEHNKIRSTKAQFLKDWILAWESKDLHRYLEFYDKDFTAPGGFNFRSWKRHKEKLTQKYDSIQVRLDQPFLLIHQDQMIVRALQRYTSNQHTDYGVKVIYARLKNGRYSILREEWAPASESGEILSSTTSGPISIDNFNQTSLERAADGSSTPPRNAGLSERN